ncbi:endonuclease VII domain-containing protein [Devosia elaeis]|uniref:endonuclease VII domain-containing protein n=1 Tax=Devosia elaeis TaxID=1770058 RepID=UPI0009EE3092
MGGTLFPANDNDVEPWNFWHGLEISKLPKTSGDARDRGIAFFYTGEPCLHGHDAPRYSKGGRCCACTNLSSARHAGRGYGQGRGAARANLMRSIAAMSMARIYTPLRPCIHGHWERFVSSNNCVECDRLARERRKERAKELRLVREYGITSEGRDSLAASQGNRCAICEEPFNDLRSMHVDHCHDTGKVRGILCSLCNQAIGLLKENASVIRKAADYVQEHSSKKAA